MNRHYIFIAVTLLAVSGLTLPSHAWDYHVDKTRDYILALSPNHPDLHYTLARVFCGNQNLHQTYPWIGQVMHRAGAGWCDFWVYDTLGTETPDSSLLEFFDEKCRPITGMLTDSQHQTLCPADWYKLTGSSGPFDYPENGGSRRWTRALPSDSLRKGQLIFYEYDFYGGFQEHYTAAIMFVQRDQGDGEPTDLVNLVGILQLSNGNWHYPDYRTYGFMRNWWQDSGNCSTVRIKPVGSGSIPQFPVDFIRQQREHKP